MIFNAILFLEISMLDVYLKFAYLYFIFPGYDAISH